MPNTMIVCMLQVLVDECFRQTHTVNALSPETSSSSSVIELFDQDPRVAHRMLWGLNPALEGDDVVASEQLISSAMAQQWMKTAKSRPASVLWMGSLPYAGDWRAPETGLNVTC